MKVYTSKQMKERSPFETIGSVGKSALDFAGKATYYLATHGAVATLNKEGGIASRATTLLGYAMGTQNKQYLYYEIGPDGTSRFLGATNKNIRDPKKIIYNKDESTGKHAMDRIDMSDFVHTTQAVRDVTNGLFGDKDYDPLFRNWRNSIPSEQVELYRLHGTREKIADIDLVGTGGKKATIVRVDRFNPYNMALSTAYWLYREAKFKTLTYPLAMGMIDLLEKTGVDTNLVMEDFFALDSQSDEAFTGIGYYPQGIEPKPSGVGEYLQSLDQEEEMKKIQKEAAIGAQNPAYFDVKMNEIAAEKQRIKEQIGDHSTELLAA